jgi:phosphoribulokinase
MNTIQYFYTDQNNNTYTITSAEVWYDPVTPNESSSGVYSGGEKAVVPISEDTFAEIVLLAEDLQKDSLNHIDRREMRTAILLTEKDGEDISRVILKPSENRTSLEKLLIDLIE